MVRYLILGILRGGARTHGYALVKEYRERSGADIGSGNFYRELQRLVRDGLIRGCANDLEIDARRMPYEITDRGIAAFDEWLSGQEVAVDGFSEDEISARALFIAEAEQPLVESLLGRLKEGLWFLGKRLERDRQRLLSRISDDDDSRSRRSVLLLLLARRQRYVVADLEFVEGLRSEAPQWPTRRYIGAARDAGADATAPAMKPARRQSPAIAAAGRARGRSYP